MPTTVAPGVVQIDTLLGGWERVTAGYLVQGPSPVLVETGARSSVPTLLAALDELGVGPGDLAGVALTHIHLDHAGGAGDVARAFPGATIYVHPRGARHLADPTRLLASAAQVYGPRLDGLYGRLLPTPPERIAVLADGDRVELGGGRHLATLDAPGHAKHHLALLDSETGTLFTGDAAGVRLPSLGVAWPATPPPDFDLDQALASLRRFGDRRPAAAALAHFGVVADAPALLDEAADRLQRWAAVAEAAWAAGTDLAGALEAAFGGELAGADPEGRHHLEVLNGTAGNAEGLRGWLARRRPPDR